MLAHQGGWDEILLVVGPMAVIVVLLRLAKGRIERAAAAPQVPPRTPEHPAASEPDLGHDSGVGPGNG